MKVKATVKSTFFVHEVVVLTGFTKYMLDYLAREDIFAPSDIGKSSRGVRRRYTYEDVVLLRALNAICIGKGKIRHLKDALLRFRTTFGSMKPGQRLDKQLYVQGDELCVFTSAEGGRQLRSGQMTFSFVVDLSAVNQALSDCVEVEPRTGELRLNSEAARAAEEERQRIWSAVRTRRELAA
jgi:hypothetical protein